MQSVVLYLQVDYYTTHCAHRTYLITLGFVIAQGTLTSMQDICSKNSLFLKLQHAPNQALHRWFFSQHYSPSPRRSLDYLRLLHEFPCVVPGRTLVTFTTPQSHTHQSVLVGNFIRSYHTHIVASSTTPMQSRQGICDPLLKKIEYEKRLVCFGTSFSIFHVVPIY